MTAFHAPQGGLRDQVSFRIAAPTDAAPIVALIELSYRGPGAGTWDSEAHLLTGPRTSLGEVRALISDPDSRFVVMTSRQAIIGCALVQNRGRTAEQAGSGGAYFGMFAVSPSYRSAGLGDLLLAECERRVQALWNASAMVMTVISVRTELIGWYGRRGYFPTGVRLAFPFSATSGETTRDFDLVELRKPLAAAG